MIKVKKTSKHGWEQCNKDKKETTRYSKTEAQKERMKKATEKSQTQFDMYFS